MALLCCLHIHPKKLGAALESLKECSVSSVLSKNKVWPSKGRSLMDIGCNIRILQPGSLPHGDHRGHHLAKVSTTPSVDCKGHQVQALTGLSSMSLSRRATLPEADSCKISTNLWVFSCKNSTCTPREATIQPQKSWYTLKSSGTKREDDPGSTTLFEDEDEALNRGKA